MVLMGQMRLMALFGQHEFARNDMAALVDQLIKSVLTICTGLTPNDRPRRIGEVMTVNAHALAVGLHFKLL